ncbi:alpha/beta hydrolase [Frankia sp. RB7]|nr:alpha/beta hydrolase [Frankia sp. RB7]
MSAERSIVASDGTAIGYRQSGSGPGLVLLHGAMQSAASFTDLGAALADRFTVLIPDRRGRGLSGPFRPDHCMATEIDDLGRLLAETGAQDVFALSAGAVVAMHTALVNPAISRLALYEPPLEVGAIQPRYWAASYEAALAKGNLPAAFAAALKGTGDDEIMTRLPAPVLTSFFAMMMRLRPNAAVGNGPPLATLIPTVHYDIELIAETAGDLDRFRRLSTKTLLLGGDRSQGYLTAALDALVKILPNAARVELKGAGHIAADNEGDPARVAVELRRFFA